MIELALEKSTPFSAAAARAAGLRCIILRHPLMRGHDFVGATRVVDSVDELREAIQRLARFLEGYRKRHGR